MLWQPSLPERYTKADSADLQRDIADRRARLGDKLVILGHHYQTDAVVRHADLTGDSLKLSQLAASVCDEKPVEHLIFCGVHFMAESADMLSPEHVTVSLPDLSAGCSMADMAQIDDCIHAWDTIHEELKAQGFAGRVIPITYVPSKHSSARTAGPAAQAQTPAPSSTGQRAAARATQTMISKSSSSQTNTSAETPRIPSASTPKDTPPSTTLSSSTKASASAA